MEKRVFKWQFPELTEEVNTKREGLRHQYDNSTSPRSCFNPQLPLQGGGHTRTNAIFMEPAAIYEERLRVTLSDLKRRNQKIDDEVRHLRSTAGQAENQLVFNKKKSQKRASRRHQERKVQTMVQANAYLRTLDANAPLGPHQQYRVQLRDLGQC
jgi:hypothetical protein